MTERIRIPLYSSGKHQFLNRQPWAIIEDYTDEAGEEHQSINARFTSRAKADAYLSRGPSYSVHHGDGRVTYPQNERVEYDPIPWDGEPLNHPGNPIVADLRDEEGKLDWYMVDWWTRQIDEVIDFWDTTPGYVEHARRVIHLLESVLRPVTVGA